MIDEKTEIYATEEQVQEHFAERRRKLEANTSREDSSQPESNGKSATPDLKRRLTTMLRWPLTVLGLGLDDITLAAATGFPPYFLTLSELEELCQQEPPSFLVEGLLPDDDVHVAVGDSGIGKTAWAYQLGLCVATGRPFLGHSVRQSPVLYYDMENGRQQILDLARGLCRHLEIDPFPADFLVFPNDRDCLPVREAVPRYKPGLVIIDALRAFAPEAEMDNSAMAELLEILRSHARGHHCAILLLHHIRKSSEIDRATSLEETPAMEWLQRASGARALVNQTNTRIALALPHKADAALAMKSFVKLQGESGPVFLQRVCDEEGEPTGYSPAVGVELIGDKDEQDAFTELPQEFRFKEAVKIFKRGDDPTNKRLRKYIALGILEKLSRGKYRKLGASAQNQ
jgi:hypothetical protein